MKRINNRKYDLTNQEFGQLFVLEYDENICKYKCRCKCGKICYMKTHRLTHGLATHCGCLCRSKTLGKTIKCLFCNRTLVQTMFPRTKDGYRRNKCKECIRPDYREIKKRRIRQYRLDALIQYGGDPPRCACCYEDRLEFLTIDHVKGGGSKHRQKLKCGHQIYTWLKQNKYPDGFQVLCMNCNFAKGIHLQCPHILKKQNPAELVIDNAITYLKKIKPIIYTKIFQETVELIKTHRVWITGAGKMALISQKFATTLACNNIQANFLDPSQALHGCLGAVHSDELVIIISNSGKTDEIIQIAQKLNEKHIKIIVITASIDSPLGKSSNLVLNYGPIIEACSLGLTPTTSCLVILAICDALVMSVQQVIGTTYDDYVWNHHRGWIGEIAKQKANKEFNKTTNEGV